MDNQDIRWIQRFHNYKKALHNLQAGVQLSRERKLSDLEKQGVIKAFEFTHELAWNTMRDFFRNQGAQDTLYGSRDSTRLAFREGLVDDGFVWMDMIESRNKTVHAYDEKIMAGIYDRIISRYFPAFKALEDRLGMESEKCNSD